MCLFAGAGVGFGIASFRNAAPVVVYAEGEETSEQPVETSEPVEEPQENKEESSKWEEIEKKVKEISNYQVLGMTIGTIVGGLASIGITYLMKKAEKIELRKFTEFSREGAAQYKQFMNKADELTANYGVLHDEFVAFREQSDALVAEIKEENKYLKECYEEEKAARLEERKFFLELISNTKETVASGLAEKLNKYFEDKD